MGYLLGFVSGSDWLSLAADSIILVITPAVDLVTFNLGNQRWLFLNHLLHGLGGFTLLGRHFTH